MNDTHPMTRDWLTCQEAPSECTEKFRGRTLAEASRAFYAHVAETHRTRGGGVSVRMADTLADTVGLTVGLSDRPDAASHPGASSV